MPFFESSQEWLTQSTLLFQAYPTSSRVTTKYTIHPPPSPDARKRKRQPDDSTPDQPPTAEQKPPAAPKASLTLKTFDPVSGVCLKYRTDKAAEVGRLIASLGRLGKHMAALPDADVTGDAEKILDAAADGAGQDGAEKAAAGKSEGPAATPAAEGDGKGAQPGKPGGGGGGAKKKKKGKK